MHGLASKEYGMDKMVSVADKMVMYILYAANDCSKIPDAKYHQLLLERHASVTGHSLSAVEQHNRFPSFS